MFPSRTEEIFRFLKLLSIALTTDFVKRVSETYLKFANSSLLTHEQAGIPDNNITIQFISSIHRLDGLVKQQIQLITICFVLP